MKKLILPAMAFVLVLSGCASGVSSYIVTNRDEDVYTSPTVSSKDYQKANFVLETRGGGEIACVNIGKKDGAKNETKITFYKINESMGKKYQISFAEGRIFQVGDESSWVKVKSYETASVKKNNFAKIADDQNYTFGEKMLFPPRFWKK